MQTSAISQLLHEHQLKTTAIRVEVLGLFPPRSPALGSAEILARLRGRFDRATLFRTLNTLVEAGLLHTVPHQERGLLYAPCQASCTQSGHHDEHAHFTCEACSQIVCLPNSKALSKPRLPKGYVARQVQFHITGLCPSCSD